MTIEFTELPLDLSGKVYRSVMPYGFSDPGGEIYPAYIAAQISAVVVLVDIDEMVRIAGRNLIPLYQQQGWNVLHLPIKDYGIPDEDLLSQAVESMLDLAQEGENIAIHCSGGLGRSGMLAACMAKRVFGIAGEQAIAWVRRYIPEAVETKEQMQLVVDF